MKRNKSPCIDICEFSGPHDWCLGYGRTRDECDRWKKMKPYEFKKLKKQLKNRMFKMSEN